MKFIPTCLVIISLMLPTLACSESTLDIDSPLMPGTKIVAGDPEKNEFFILAANEDERTTEPTVETKQVKAAEPLATPQVETKPEVQAKTLNPPVYKEPEPTAEVKAQEVSHEALLTQPNTQSIQKTATPKAVTASIVTPKLVTPKAVTASIVTPKLVTPKANQTLIIDKVVKPTNAQAVPMPKAVPISDKAMQSTLPIRSVVAKPSAIVTTIKPKLRAALAVQKQKPVTIATTKRAEHVVPAVAIKRQTPVRIHHVKHEHDLSSAVMVIPHRAVHQHSIDAEIKLQQKMVAALQQSLEKPLHGQSIQVKGKRKLHASLQRTAKTLRNKLSHTLAKHKKKNDILIFRVSVYQPEYQAPMNMRNHKMMNAHNTHKRFSHSQLASR